MYNEPIPIKKKSHNKKPLMLVLTIIMFLGVSFAAVYYVSNQSDSRVNKLVSELIDIEFTEQSENINLSEEEAVPMLDALGKQNPPYSFTVKNISNVPIRVYISLNINNITINKSALRYALYIDDEEIITSDLSKLDENNTLYTLENLDPDESVTGKIVFWIDYYYENTKESFDATIKVTGESKDYIADGSSQSETPTTGIATEVLKAKIGTGGLVGIPTNCSEESCTPITDKSVDKSTIREYRYSGEIANNYVYFNCKDNLPQNGDNCETWRIIGIFKEDAGQEHIKIVRNEVLEEKLLPDEYEASGKTFKIKNSGINAYWDYDGSTGNNNWGAAGLMNWLNSTGIENGYMKTLSTSAQNMIAKTKYYLGSVIAFNGGNDTTVLAYEHERAITGCTGNIGPSENSSQSAVEGNSTCRVWANNAAYWEGWVALMYPSDYGFASDSSNWSTKKLYSDYSTYITTNWLFQDAKNSVDEWFLSPSSYNSGNVASWGSDGRVYRSHVGGDRGVRPSFNLQSQIEIVDGSGTSGEPYKLG